MRFTHGIKLRPSALRRRIFHANTFLLILAVMTGNPATSRIAFSHPGITEALIQASSKIAISPTAANYFARAEIYRGHGEAVEALRDYQQALRLDPSLIPCHLLSSKLLLEQGNYEAAYTAIQHFIDHCQSDSKALFIRGQILANLGRHAEAIDDFAFVITSGDAPAEECYIARAKSILQINANNHEQALQGLDEGILKLGETSSLADYAIQLCSDLNLVDSAIERIDRLLAHRSNHAMLLLQKAQLCKRNGDNATAIKQLQGCISHIYALPSRIQQNGQTQMILDQARSQLISLAEKPQNQLK